MSFTTQEYPKIALRIFLFTRRFPLESSGTSFSPINFVRPLRRWAPRRRCRKPWPEGPEPMGEISMTWESSAKSLVYERFPIIWGFPKIGVPRNHPFTTRFFDFKATIWGYPHSRKPPIGDLNPLFHKWGSVLENPMKMDDDWGYIHDFGNHWVHIFNPPALGHPACTMEHQANVQHQRMVMSARPFQRLGCPNHWTQTVRWLETPRWYGPYMPIWHMEIGWYRLWCSNVFKLAGTWMLIPLKE